MCYDARKLARRPSNADLETEGKCGGTEPTRRHNFKSFIHCIPFCRSRTKLKRRCSINGHFYNRETSFFTPPRGSQMSVWVSSLLSTQDVVNLILEKYKVESRPEHFALYVMRDSGEQRRLKDDDYPLLVRILLGPHEDVARIFLMDTQTTSEIRYLYLFNNRSTVVLKIVLIFFRSCEMAQFINLSVLECKSILDRYEEERQREENRIREK